jgi:uncharacterized coiled-coil DUF342 family protein
MKELIESIKERLDWLAEYCMIRPEGEMQFKQACQEFSQMFQLIRVAAEQPVKQEEIPEYLKNGINQIDTLIKNQDLILAEIQAINENFTGKVTPVEPPPDTTTA